MRALPEKIRRGEAWLWEAVDRRQLDWFRRSLALLLAVRWALRLPFASEWMSIEGLHPPAAIRFSSDPLALPMLPAWACRAVVLGGTVVFLYAAGRRPPIRILATALLFATYGTLVDPYASSSIDKISLFCLVILTLTARSIACGTPRWSILALKLFFITQYTASGLAKALNGTWLTDPATLESQLSGAYRTPVAAWLLELLPADAWSAVQYSVLGFELLAAPLFLIRRLRVLGVVAGAGLHLGIALCMDGLWQFSALMLCFYVLLVPSEALVQKDLT